MSEKFVLAIDQGTTSSRAIVFNHEGQIVGSGQEEHEQIFPRAGWVEHDPMEIWAKVQKVVELALADAGKTKADLVAVGITNQRETTVVWNKETGQPVYNAIVWQDTRTGKIVEELGGGNQDKYKERVGLPLATYFCGPKVKWILDNVAGARGQAEGGKLVMGTIDSWVIWNLTGGVNGGVHITDVTNASRTMLMDLKTLSWDPEIAADMTIPMSMLPEIKSSAEVYGTAVIASIEGIPVAGDLGDQQAATFGQACFEPGMAKNTYGTGCFLVMNTGDRVVESKHGLLATVACPSSGASRHLLPANGEKDYSAAYALEGSVFIAGAAVQWLRDSLGIIKTANDIEALAASVPDSGGAVFVPSFTGLGAPHWDPYARGAMLGLTRGTTAAHIARATLEAIALQTADVLDAMRADSELELKELRVDGAASKNDLLMQMQADIAGVRVVRSRVAETTALGAAYLAGLGVGLWSEEQIDVQWKADRVFEPRNGCSELRERWRDAIGRVKT